MELLCDRVQRRAVAGLFTDQDVRLGSLEHGEVVPLTVAVVDSIPETSTSRIWEPLDTTADTIKVAIGSGFSSPVAGVFSLISGVDKTSGLLVNGARYQVYDYVAGDDFTNIGGENADGEIFTATGTTPTTWTNSSKIREVTSLLDYDSTASEIEAALNLLPTIIAAGEVEVEAVGTSFFTITFGNVGAQNQIEGDAANLAPLSLIDAGTLIDGTSERREVQTIHILQDAGSFVTLTDNTDAASLDIASLQTGGGGQNHKVRATISPVPYDGSFTLTVRSVESSVLAFNASAASVKSALEELSLTGGSLISGAKYKIITFVSGDDFSNVGASANETGVVFTASGTTPTDWTNGSALSPVGADNVSVTKEANGQYLIVFQGDMSNTNMGTITGDDSSLLAIRFKTGEIDLRTSGIEMLLINGDTTSTIEAWRYPISGTPQCVFRREVSLVVPVVKPASSTPTPREQFYNEAEIDAQHAAIFSKAPALSVTGAGDSSILKASEYERHGTHPVSMGAGSGAYTATLSLSLTDAVAGDVKKLPISFAASTNPTAEIRNATSGGTLLYTIAGTGSAFKTCLTFTFNGTAWESDQ